MRKKKQKLEESFYQALDKKLQLSGEWEEIAKKMDLDLYAKPKQKKSKIWIYPTVCAACASLLLVTVSLLHHFLPNDSTDTPIGDVDNPSTTLQFPEEGTPPSSEKTYVPYKGNLIDELKNHFYMDGASSPSMELGMCDIFYHRDGTIKETPLYLYEIVQTPCISQEIIAFYLCEDGVSQYQKEYEIAEDTLDGTMVKWYYGNNHDTQYDCRWYTFQKKEEIPIQINEFQLSGLFVIDEVFLHQEVLSATKIEKKYDFYRSMTVPIDDKINENISSMIDEKVEQIAWYPSNLSIEYFSQDTSPYFNRFERETNGFQKLAIVEDPYVRLSSQKEHESFYQNFEKKVDELCLVQQEGNEKTYRYNEYCSFLQSYKPQ